MDVSANAFVQIRHDKSVWYNTDLNVWMFRRVILNILVDFTEFQTNRVLKYTYQVIKIPVKYNDFRLKEGD